MSAGQRTNCLQCKQSVCADALCCVWTSNWTISRLWTSMLQPSGLLHCSVREVSIDLSKEIQFPSSGWHWPNLGKLYLCRPCYGPGGCYRSFTAETGFDPKPAYVGSVLDKGLLEQVLLRVLRLSPLSVILPVICTLLHMLYNLIN
jgi:hypothetical protein